ncbi:hypothetical protein D3C71_1760520 [compost metagenome]
MNHEGTGTVVGVFDPIGRQPGISEGLLHQAIKMRRGLFIDVDSHRAREVLSWLRKFEIGVQACQIPARFASQRQGCSSRIFVTGKSATSLRRRCSEQFKTIG